MCLLTIELRLTTNYAILIKITQCHYLVRIFLQNRTTDFDETLHVAWTCLPEESMTTGTSGYSPVKKILRPGEYYSARKKKCH